MVENISQEYKTEIRNQAVRQAAKWTLAGAVVLIGLAATGWWLYLQPKIDKYITSRSDGLPPGAVVAFDLKSGCPKDWIDVGSKEAERFAGRTIIAAGPRVDRTDNQTTIKRSYDDAGGEEKVTLGEATMPPHHHKEPKGVRSGSTFALSYTGNDIALRQGNGDPIYKADHVHEIESEGGGEAHQNMPPFIALLYCKKA